MSEDLAWAAGFFDGEGCILIARNSPGVRGGRIHTSPSHHLKMTAQQTDERPLLKLQALFGGTVNERRNLPQNKKRIWGWYLSDNAAVKALMDMLPWLIVKRSQARLAIDFRNFIDVTARYGIHPSEEEIGIRDAYWAAMKEMKHMSR